MNDNVASLSESLQQTGRAIYTTPYGKRVFLVLWEEPRGILMTAEGGGSYFFDGTGKLTQFTLFKYGFDAIVAPTLIAVVRGIFADVAAQRESQGAAIPQRLLTAECRE